MQRFLVFLIFCFAAFPNIAAATPLHFITCRMVRAYVTKVGVEQARTIAAAHGMTLAQERRATRCLGKGG